MYLLSKNNDDKLDGLLNKLFDSCTEKVWRCLCGRFRARRFVVYKMFILGPNMRSVTQAAPLIMHIPITGRSGQMTACADKFTNKYPLARIVRPSLVIVTIDIAIVQLLSSN